MTRPKLFKEDPKKICDILNHAIAIADQIHQLENELVHLLKDIDENRYYVRYGINSLRGFCVTGLLFSKTQAQRIAIRASELSTHTEDGQLRNLD